MQTFVIRVWTPADGPAEVGGSSDLHGVLERPGSANAEPFRGSRELLRLLRAGVAEEEARSTDRRGP